MCTRARTQVDKDIAKALGAMGDLEGALAAKKEVSGRVKALRKALEAARKQSADAGMQQDHLRRQQDIVAERITAAKEQVPWVARLPHQPFPGHCGRLPRLAAGALGLAALRAQTSPCRPQSGPCSCCQHQRRMWGVGT